jgi:hypothetical protein
LTIYPRGFNGHNVQNSSFLELRNGIVL